MGAITKLHPSWCNCAACERFKCEQRRMYVCSSTESRLNDYERHVVEHDGLISAERIG